MGKKQRNQAVQEWVKYNNGLSRQKEYDVYTAVWQLGAKVARGFARSLDQAELDDCIHDVMLRISQQMDIVTMDYPSAYFCRAVRYACLDRLRANKHRANLTMPESDDDTPWEQSIPGHDAALDVLFEHEQCVDQVLARLNKEQKRNLELALDIRMHNLSADEVARREGRSARAITQGVSNFVNVTLRRLIDEVCPGLVAQATGRRK